MRAVSVLLVKGASSHDAMCAEYVRMLHIAQDKYGKSFEDCDSKERQSVGGTKVWSF